MSHRRFTCLGVTSFLLLTFFLSTQTYAQNALNIALNHFEIQRESLGLTSADIQNFRISDEYSSRHNGVTHIYLQQQYEEINLVNAITNFNILPDGKVVSMGNRFIQNLASKVNTTQPNITPLAAVNTMIAHFKIETNETPSLERQMTAHHFVFKKEGIALEPVNVRLMFQPVNNQKEVRLVWQVDIYELDAQNWRVASIDAVTNEVVFHYNQVVTCNFPQEHSNEECPEHHVGHSQTTKQNELPPVVIDNAYNVYPLPLESPNHGDQQLLVSPADAIASPFGWHDVDGIDGHEYTITRGNNVHAYHDIFALNASIGDEPDGGDTLVFDIPYDESNFSPFEQRDAATINLFYWNNVIHDIWYQYGFDEVSGNFQENNYGNGGEGNDHVNAEALDGSGTNNANFATPVDGMNGRMQMYFWGGGQTATPPSVELYVLSPGAVAGTYPMGLGNFGADLMDTITSQVILVDDGEGNPSDACQAIVNTDEINGNIALIDRGTCNHGQKAIRAQDAGAIAVIFCNDENEVYSPNGGPQGGDVNIPIVTITQQNCEFIKLGLIGGLMVQLIEQELDYQVPSPGPTGRDSDLDNGVIIHEYGHGISNRLTGGPSQSGCLSTNQNPEQMGEGWSDWFALVMTLTADDIGESARGIGTYSIAEPIDGPGIRNFQYSTDLATNPQTYSSIIPALPNGPPHDVGEVWAVTIWDLYWNFIDIYGFDSDFYNGTGGNNMVMQLVIDGLKFQPCQPTFIDGRDAILAADVANFDGAHECLIWETFARRGVGFSASQGGAEAFDLPPFCTPFLKITKTAETVVDAGDVINYTLTLRNDTPESLATATIEDQLPANATYVAGSSSCGGTVVDGVLSITLNNFASGDEIECTYQLQTNSNVLMNMIFEDDVEGSTSTWSKTANLGSTIWLPSNITPNSGTRSWKSGSPDTPSDQLLTLKEPVLLSGTNPALAFWHRYRTEDGFDGGVVEISTDEGMTWEDLGPNFILNGYNGTLADDTTNPLANQNVFTGNSNVHIQSIADLSAYIGEEIIVRFRFATNEGGIGEGWFVDDIQIFDELEVVLNEACLTDNAQETVCNQAGTVVLGDPTSTKEVLPQSSVTLFPNPTTGNIVIEWTDQLAEIEAIQLFNIDGRSLSTWTVDSNANNLSLNITQFGKGVFMLQILTNNQLITKKVVVK
jgi:extracellular elastinolytic metalloproteinase